MWYAASEGHNSVLYYLLREKHDSYSLLEDRRVSNLGYCHQNSFDRQIVPKGCSYFLDIKSFDI